MNIITTNCLGGFIYRDILKQEYKNPFIWTGCACDFVDFLKNFDKINFDNINIISSNNKHDGIMYIVIDEKYKWRNMHVKFSANDDIPRYYNFHEVYYNKPWEYIYNNYMKRLKRMKNEKQMCVIIYEPCINAEIFKEIANVCYNKKIPCLFFTDVVNINNFYIKTIYTKPLNPGNWFKIIIEKYSTDILNFINTYEIRDYNI